MFERSKSVLSSLLTRPGPGFTMPLLKAQDEKRLASYWLSQVETADGLIVKDCYDHVIPVSVLEDAAVYFMLNHRVAAYRHLDKDGKRGATAGPVVGHGVVVGSWVTSRDWQAAVGLPEGALPVGWMVQTFVEKDSTWAEIKAGTLPDMSLGGDGALVPVDLPASAIAPKR